MLYLLLVQVDGLAVRPSMHSCRVPTTTVARTRELKGAGGLYAFDPPWPKLKVHRGKGHRAEIGDWFPRGDATDQRIAGVLLPSVANLMVVPITGAVDTFWVGRMGNALALAGQGAANQLFAALFFLMSFVAMVTVPLVASSYARGDIEGARDRTCDSLLVGGLMGLIGTLALVGRPEACLQLVLQPDALAMPYAARYLRLRALGLIPALVSAVAFAAFRGVLDVVTPLRVSLASNLLNLVLDPLLIFGGGVGAGLGVAGAALATTISEVFAGGFYLWLLMRKRLASWARLIRLPDARAMGPLLRVSSALLFRTGLWNAIMLLRARAAQAMDPSGVSAAAYAITLQIYYLGLVFSTALQSTTTALVASAGARSPAAARAEAGRMLGWSGCIGSFVMVAQLAALPVLIPIFTTVPAVQQALVPPAICCALLQLVNSVSYTSEGICMALSKWGVLVRTLAACFGAFLLAVDVTTRLGMGLVGTGTRLKHD